MNYQLKKRKKTKNSEEIRFSYRESNMKKLLVILLSVLMVITVSGCKEKVKPVEPDNKNAIVTETQKAFDQLQKAWTREDLQESYLNMHFTLVDPKAYGIESYDIDLGKVDYDEENEEIDTYEERLKKLKEFKLEDLTPDQQVTYKTISQYYEMMLDFYELEYDCMFLFRPSSGIATGMITNYLEFPLRNEQDVKDFITLIKDTRRFFDDCIEYTRRQNEDGIIQTSSTMKDIISTCEDFLEPEECNIITYQCKMIDALDIPNKETYKAELADAINTYMVPAYQDVIDFYNASLSKAVTKGNMCLLPDGAKYYEMAFMEKTGVYQSLDTMIDELYSAMQAGIKDLEKAASKLSYLSDYGYSDPEKILQYLEKTITKDVPAIKAVNYKVEYLDSSVVSDSTLAYYLVPPLDNVENNVIKVNPSVSDNNELCTTLAHEGFPGHLYQFNYYLQNHPDNDIRNIIDYTGYSEGWAKYAEILCYPYFITNSDEIAYMRAYDRTVWALYAYTDIMIHYKGWDVKNIEYALKKLGLNESIAESLYDVLVGDPLTYPAYGVGLTKMWGLRTKAEEQLGKKFDVKAFNKVILDTGNTSYDILEKEVDRYISENK